MSQTWWFLNLDFRDSRPKYINHYSRANLLLLLMLSDRIPIHSCQTNYYIIVLQFVIFSLGNIRRWIWPTKKARKDDRKSIIKSPVLLRTVFNWTCGMMWNFVENICSIIRNEFTGCPKTQGIRCKKSVETKCQFKKRLGGEKREIYCQKTSF